MSTAAAPIPTDHARAAVRSARLVYTCDTCPGIRRVTAGGRVRYVDPVGRAVRDADALARIRSLVIPPAWTDVWVCPDPDGHIQATGRDARGRKQYRYHPRWREVRDGTKFNQLATFAETLPTLRGRVDADLSRPGLPREKVLAAVVRLLDATQLRIGNSEYVRSNKSFGLSTLRDHHVRFDGGALRLRFRGKSGVWHERSVADRRLARVVRNCRDLPGQELFQYVSADGVPRAIGSADVNDYIRTAAGGDFTAKVFRTWAGTVKAAVRLRDHTPASCAAAKRAVVQVVKDVAGELGNTPAVCRKSYIHPALIDAFLTGRLDLPQPSRLPAGLSADEAAVLGFLRGLPGAWTGLIARRRR